MTPTASMRWKEIPSEQYCDSVRDGTHDSPKFLDAGFPLITSKNIKMGQIVFDSVNLISESDFKEINRRSKVDQWDVLFSMIGTVGEVCLVQDEEPSFAIKNIGLFKSGDELKGKWLYYSLTNPITKAAIKQAHRGASQQYIPLGELRKLPIRVPTNQDVMHRVVDVLSTYDDLIENNRRRMALLEESARLLYSEWFVRLRFPGHEHTPITDGIPQGWDKGCVSDFYDTSSGGTPSRKFPEYFTGEIPWVKTQELSNGFITHTDENITEDALANSSAKLFPERTVLIALYGATVGELGITALSATTNQACCAVLPKDMRAHYVHAFLFFREHKEKLVSLSAGAAQKNISQQIVRGVEMIMPDKMLMRMFVDTVSPAFDQLLNLERSNQKLRAARDLLLPRLMSGDIAV